MCSAMAKLSVKPADVFESMCSLTNVHLSTGAQYFVDVCLLICSEGALILVRREWSVGGPGLIITVKSGY